MKNLDMIELMTRNGEPDRHFSLMMCFITEGRETSVDALDDKIDHFATKMRNDGKRHPFGELDERRIILRALVKEGALEEVKTRGGGIAGWRLTPVAIEHYRCAMAFGGVDYKDIPEWLR